MKTALKNRIIIVLSALFVFSVLSFAFTKARYTEEKDPDNHSGELEYTVADQIIVYNTEQFFAAVETGYPNVKIADTVSNPFMVSGTADVKSDLILDLNGHQIQRNSREPMLTVKEGVKMVVADTSKSQKGSFYNPVGSVLKIDGGVLTVMSNTFESGPRANEYYSNKGDSQYIGGKISQTATIQVTFKGGTTEDCTAPILLPSVKEAQQGAVTDGKSYFVNGNIYFDIPVAGYSDKLIKQDDPTTEDIIESPDTYFYFTIDDANASSEATAASTDDADFRYSYYVSKSGSDYTYEGPSQNTENTLIKVTIYGYRNVKASARNEVAPYNKTPSNFAAIKMLSGSMYSRGGIFYSYFGVDTSSCIYADEGTLSVYGGSYEAIDEGVAVKCNYLREDSEFTITDGNFKSYKGDIIQMQNGRMTITGGTFVKDSSAYTEGNAGSNNNNSAIKLQAGTMYLDSAQDTPINFYLAGRYMAAIECGSAAEINSTGVNYQFGTTNGEDPVPGGNNIGILSEGGNVNVTNCVFIQPGDYSYGIYSYDRTDADDTRHSTDVVSSIFSMGGERSTGIYANGGIINIGCEDDLYNPIREQPVYGPDGNEVAKGVSMDNYTIFYLDHVANCYGVYVEKRAATAELTTYATNTQINVYAGQFIVGSGYNSAGKNYAEWEIPDNPRLDGNGTYVAYAGHSGNETLDVGTLQHNEKVWSAGVYVNDQTATVSLGKVRMILGGSYTAGIFAEKGNIERLYDSTKDEHFVQSEEYKNKVPTIALFVGTRMVGYKNGGYLNEAATEKYKKWNYLYKHDFDYYQTPNFVDYYDRIVNCNSTDDYGIAAKSGIVHIGRIYLNLRSEYSRGIYATSLSTTASNVVVDNCNANIDSKKKILVNGKEEYVVPETLTTTTMTIRNGNVTIHDADVRTNAVGIVINNGQLNFESKIKFEAVNASAIYMTSTAMVSGGTSGSQNNLTINENAKVSIFCNIRESKTDLTEPTPWKLKNVHYREDDESKIPSVADAQKNNLYYMISTNGINIKGGSVTCNGELTVDFHGVNNKNQTTYDPYNIPLAGCAINVEQLTGSDKPEVNIWHAHITAGKAAGDYTSGDKFYANANMGDISSSNAGGGISVKGGDVYLGNADNTFYTNPDNKGYQVLNYEHNKDYNKLITVETFGKERYRNSNGSFNYLNNPNYKDGSTVEAEKSYDNWKYAVSKTGGPGIKVESGNITVKHGTYYASQGNGILLVGGTATVQDGIFQGKNTEWKTTEGDATGSGLGSYYGFMLRGGGTLTIHKGLFEGFNGGAFVTGSSETSMATAYVYGGTFEDMPERRLQRQTTNGFSVGPYSLVTLGKETELPEGYVAPKIQGIACGIAVENNRSFTEEVFGTTDYFSQVTITIQGGTVVRATKGNRSDNNVNAIWKGNHSATLRFGECTLYQQHQIAQSVGDTLIFTDGEIIGNTVVNGENHGWSKVIDVNAYDIYTYSDKSTFSKITDFNAWVSGSWCYKLVITKKPPQTT